MERDTLSSEPCTSSQGFLSNKKDIFLLLAVCLDTYAQISNNFLINLVS